MNKFITFDQLMSSVETDLNNFADNGMINRGSMIKVVRKVNEDIGLKINKEKSVVLEVKNNKADLPNDFLFMQIAFALGETAVVHKPGEIFGTVTREYNDVRELPVGVLDKSQECLINDCGGQYWVTQLFKDKMVEYRSCSPMRVRAAKSKLCMPLPLNSRAQGEIELEDGYIVTHFEEGRIYLNYLADMQDEDGNLLLLDHPLTTEYYEYAVKKHLLETWLLNSDADVAQKLGYIKEELRQARIRALNFTNTVEYSQIQRTFEANRRRFYNRFIRIFE